MPLTPGKNCPLQRTGGRAEGSGSVGGVDGGGDLGAEEQVQGAVVIAWPTSDRILPFQHDDAPSTLRVSPTLTGSTLHTQVVGQYFSSSSLHITKKVIVTTCILH